MYVVPVYVHTPDERDDDDNGMPAGYAPQALQWACYLQGSPKEKRQLSSARVRSQRQLHAESRMALGRVINLGRVIICPFFPRM